MTKKVLIPLAVLIAAAAVFLAGRYGWRLLGFAACEGAGIERIEVTDGLVMIEGFDPSSFPAGFLGYCSEERDGALYVGFRFSSVFGFFETGQFQIQIPVDGEISVIYLKTRKGETLLWSAGGERME